MGGPLRRLFRLGVGRPGPGEAVDWEIEHHLSEQADRLVEAGWDREAARAEARQRFGELSRYRRRLKGIEHRKRMSEKRMKLWELVRDGVAWTVRTVCRYPGFALGVIATLALGIGANSAMFGIVDRLLLRPPAHVVDHEEVRRIIVARGDNWEGPTLTFPDFLAFRDHRGFEQAAAVSYPLELTRGRGPDATRLNALLVSHEFFPLLGVRPVAGRFFGPDEDRVGAQGTAVVSHEYWERAFGGRPDILGRTMDVRGETFTIVGVTPPGFTGVDLEVVDVWLPIETARYLFADSDTWRSHTGNWWLKTVARVPEGTSLAAAEAEAKRLHVNVHRDQIDQGRYFPVDRIHVTLASVIAARGPGASSESSVARWLLGVSLVVLLIACANVANLFLARGTRRRREVAVRLALGVSRGRLVAHMMLETVFLALLGGGAALVLARWGGDLVRGTLLPNVYFPHAALDVRVIFFTLLVSLLAGVLAGVGPALQSMRTDLTSDLAEGGSRSSGGRSRVRSGLVVMQAALSVVLLVGAGLFVRSLHAVRSQDLGLDVDRILLAQLEFAASDLDAEDRIRAYERALRRVEGIPAVASAAVTSSPFRYSYATRLRVPGIDSVPRLPGGGPYYHAVTPGYFRTVGLGLVEGRGIADRDGAGAAPVAVVNETMARELWPDERPVGQCILVGPDAETCTTVVGVVEDAARGSFRDEPFMAYYLPLAQAARAPRGLYVRAPDPRETAGPVAAALRALGPGIRYAEVQSLRDMLEPQARSWRLGATMFTVFGLLALAVAAVGLYSLLAFDVARRTREIGIRSALGAAKGRLLRAVLADGTRLVLLGVGVGLGVAWLAAPFARDLLFQVSPRDPWILVAVALALPIVSILAGLAPGLRATRIDPAEALRTK